MRFMVSDKQNNRMTYKVDKDAVLVGRSTKADAQFQHEEVSRSHAMIYHLEGRYYIEDLGGPNGVLINFKRISPQTKVEIKLTTKIGLGPNVTLQMLEENDPEVTSIQVKGPRNHTGITKRTHIMETPEAHTELRAKDTPRQREAKIQFIIIALIFGAGAYYFLAGGQDETVTPEVATEVKEEQITDPLIVDMMKRLSPGERNLYKELTVDFRRTCQLVEKEFCQRIAPPLLKHEGITFKTSELEVFRQVSQQSEDFSIVPAEIRYDFSLLFYAIKTAMLFPELEGMAFTDFDLTSSNNFYPRARIYVTKKSFKPLTLDEAMAILTKVRDIGDMPDYKEKIEGRFAITYFQERSSLNKNKK